MMPISESTRQPKNGNNNNSELTDHDDANSAVAIAQGNNTAKNAGTHQYSKGGAAADYVVDARYIYLCTCRLSTEAQSCLRLLRVSLLQLRRLYFRLCRVELHQRDAGLGRCW